MNIDHIFVRHSYEQRWYTCQQFFYLSGILMKGNDLSGVILKRNDLSGILIKEMIYLSGILMKENYLSGILMLSQ